MAWVQQCVSREEDVLSIVLQHSVLNKITQCLESMQCPTDNSCSLNCLLCHIRRTILILRLAHTENISVEYSFSTRRERQIIIFCAIHTHENRFYRRLSM